MTTKTHAAGLPSGLLPGVEVQPTRLALPEPLREGRVSIENCLSRRRSAREYSDQPVTLAEAAQLLWAAQGVSGLGGMRTAPSAGAIYPLRAYLVAGNVADVPPGVYRYDPDGHDLQLIIKGDKRKRLAQAAFGQSCLEQCAMVVLLTAWYVRVTREYGEKGVRLAHIEAGHAGQNFCLEATALGLGSMSVGKFEDDAVKQIIRLSEAEEPVYLLLAGRV
jgi:SagB-type dehydrogenase family enzyme